MRKASSNPSQIRPTIIVRQAKMHLDSRALAASPTPPLQAKASNTAASASGPQPWPQPQKKQEKQLLKQKRLMLSYHKCCQLLLV